VEIYDGYTAKRVLVELVFTESYDRIIDASTASADQRVVRQKKEALIA